VEAVEDVEAAEGMEGVQDAEGAGGAEGGASYAPAGPTAEEDRVRLVAAMGKLQAQLDASEAQIASLVHSEGNHVNRYWGYMSRAGFADKSHLMRQIEKYADIYTSRVSNLLPYTPYKHFLCPRQSLAHSDSSRLLMEHWSIVEQSAAEQSTAE